MTRTPITLFFAFVVLAATSRPPAAHASEVPERLDLGDPSLSFVDKMVIPIPVEIFCSLDKLGAGDWSGQLDFREIRLDANRSRTAILFGLVVSEGFIAVQAQDREAVRRVGRDVLRLAAALGVAQSVEGHANAVVNAAGRGEWETVRRELDRTRQTVLDKMQELRDGELVKLVSIGGWLGGTEALAGMLQLNYSVEGSDLLHQPELVARLRSDFEGLPEQSRRGRIFLQLARTLEQLETLMQADENGAISESTVLEISLATRNLVAAIYES